MKQDKLLDHRSELPRLAYLLVHGRTTYGLSQSTAAKRIGVSPAYLGRLERGEYFNPSPRILVAAAEVYKMSRADLFEAAGYVEPSELPTLPAYFHATCEGLPRSAISEMVHYCEYIQARYKNKQDESDVIPREES